MQRLDATRIAVELAGESPIIGGVGNSTFDLVPFDRPRNFYMWNSMGMASSIALGLALARPELRVVVLDGDGSILMNLGSLATEITCTSSGTTAAGRSLAVSPRARRSASTSKPSLGVAVFHGRPASTPFKAFAVR